MNSEHDDHVTRRRVLQAGAAAATAGAATGTAAAAEEGGSSGPKVVEVGPGGQNIFKPAQVYVTPGTKVKFVWKGPGHNVHATDVPDGADWDVQTEIVGPPNEYEYTFDGPTGDYKYVCDPHASLGMKGTITVTENPPENTGYQSILPNSAKTMAVGAVGSMTSVLGLAYFFMKYGGDYGDQ
jgi:plastocyanin